MEEKVYPIGRLGAMWAALVGLAILAVTVFLFLLFLNSPKSAVALVIDIIIVVIFLVFFGMFYIAWWDYLIYYHVCRLTQSALIMENLITQKKLTIPWRSFQACSIIKEKRYRLWNRFWPAIPKDVNIIRIDFSGGTAKVHPVASEKQVREFVQEILRYAKAK